MGDGVDCSSSIAILVHSRACAPAGSTACVSYTFRTVAAQWTVAMPWTLTGPVFADGMMLRVLDGGTAYGIATPQHIIVTTAPNASLRAPDVASLLSALLDSLRADMIRRAVAGSIHINGPARFYRLSEVMQLDMRPTAGGPAVEAESGGSTPLPLRDSGGSTPAPIGEPGGLASA